MSAKYDVDPVRANRADDIANRGQSGNGGSTAETKQKALKPMFRRNLAEAVSEGSTAMHLTARIAAIRQV